MGGSQHGKRASARRTLVLFAAVCSTTALAQDGPQFEDAVVVAMKPGNAPGRYIYHQAGDITAPRCFAVCPKGMYYVPGKSHSR